MHMDKIYPAVYVFLVLLTSVSSLRNHHPLGKRSAMAYRDHGTSSYISCCYVDIFCYTTCFGGPGGSLRALVPEANGGTLRTSDSRRHRHRHHHGEIHFRSKRATESNNILWKKLRYWYFWTETLSWVSFQICVCIVELHIILFLVIFITIG